MNYQILRSKRKTISLSISPEGEVVIRAPYHCPSTFIDAFARKNWEWVETHLPQVQACLADRAAYALHPGMTLPVLGTERPVTESPDGETRYLDGVWQIPSVPFVELKPQIQKQYNAIGRAYLPDQVAAQAQVMGVTYGRIRVTGANRRWASCSATGDLNFSWRLLMAPPDDVAYVIVHELSHRRYFDHSPAFWTFVAHFCPDWQTRKASLQALHQRLLHENWV